MIEIQLELAQARTDSFRTRFGTPTFEFACHAAFPLALTPDLLTHLWQTFDRDIFGEPLNVPWIAVADILLSDLCTEVGTELYEMKTPIRSVLLDALKRNPRYYQADRQVRLHELSDFLQEYVREQLNSADTFKQSFAEAQTWAALAVSDPEQATAQMAHALKTSIDSGEVGEQLRVVTITESLAYDLATFQVFIEYARGRRDSLQDPNALLDTAVSEGPTVAGVKLPPLRAMIQPRVNRLQALPPNIPEYIYGVCGLGGDQELLAANRPGWIVVTVPVNNSSRSYDFSRYAARKLGMVAVLFNDLGDADTLPLPEQYEEFCGKCADVVRRSSGVQIWVIGNEPNNRYAHPQSTPITPDSYARVFNKCRREIRAIPGHERDWVVPAAVTPFNVNTQYAGNPTGDWIKYFADVLTQIQIQGGGLDAIALHTFASTQDPTSIVSDKTFPSPHQQNHQSFRAYRDFIYAIPVSMREVPILITAAFPINVGRQDWIDQKNGWIQAAYAEIDMWNRGLSNQSIFCLCLSDWRMSSNPSDWVFADKPQLVQDLRAALREGYRVPIVKPPATPAPEIPQDEGIFISYRREDTSGWASRLYDLIKEIFRDTPVYLDVESVSVGESWPNYIRRTVPKSGVLLVVIGPHWLTPPPKGGRPRLDDPEDYVRQEIAAGLRQGVVIIPVLVGGGKLPRAEDLPPELSALSQKQAHVITDQRWEFDSALLVKNIQVFLDKPSQLRPHHTESESETKVAEELDEIVGTEGTIEAKSVDVFDPNNAFALIIGIYDYADLPQLRGNEALDLSHILRSPMLCGYRSENVTMLLDKQATRAGIHNALNQLLQISNTKSTVLIYFIGHCLRPDSPQGSFLVPYDANLTRLLDMLPSEEFIRILLRVPAQNLLAILETSYAGGFAEELQAISRRFSGEVRNNIAIMASAQSKEDSYMQSNQKYSVFTQHLLEGLRGNIESTDGMIRILDLFDYVTGRMSAEDSGQHPVLTTLSTTNFPIALHRGGFQQQHFVHETKAQSKTESVDQEAPIRKELEELYVQWGFPSEKLPSAAHPEIAFGSEHPESAFGTQQLASNLSDLSILDEKGPEEVAKAYKDNPDRVLELYRDVTEKDITKEEFEKQLQEAQNMVKNPEAFAPEVPFASKKYDLTPFKQYLKFSNIDVEKEIDDHKYEEVGDWYSWFLWGGGPHILSVLKFPLKKYKFPYHTDPFIYKFRDKAGNSLDGKQIRVALFADFGTGAYHSRYIAAQIDALRPHYAIHLGDVYYAGREHEVERNLEEPLKPLLSKMQVFTMISDHEMLSQGNPFFQYIEKKRSFNQDQQGSYFCIRSDRYQIIGLDTAYHESGRHRDPKLQEWFAARMKEGTDKKLVTILLTAHEPYELGRVGTTQLYEDIRQGVGNGKIFLWFWGHTHYCTFFDPTPQTPFYASCIGHGGFPINRVRILKQKEKNDKITGGFKPPAKWVDTSYRFNDKIRPDLANAGFVLLTLEKDQVKLQYHDWLNRPNMPNFYLKLPNAILP